MSEAFQSAGYPRSSERRSHPRYHVLLSCIALEDDNGGIILDICEDGLSMQVVRGLAGDSFTQLWFQLSQSNVWVETRGRIAWVSPSKRTAGVEFVDLSSQARTLLKQWISSNAYSTAPPQGSALGENIAQVSAVSASYEVASTVSGSEPEKAGLVVEKPSQDVVTEDPVGVLHSTETDPSEAVSGELLGKSAERAIAAELYGTGLGLTLFSEERRFDRRVMNDEQAGGSSRTRRLIRLSLAAGLLLSIFLYLGYRLRRSANDSQSRAVSASTKGPEVLSDTSLSPATSAYNAKLSLNATVFTLQVGAMKQETNADALAESLRQKDFPAFVIYPGPDHLYRVVVGPYSSVDSAEKVAKELKKQGFEAIREPPNTPAQ